jgi:hypothetical protein
MTNVFIDGATDLVDDVEDDARVRPHLMGWGEDPPPAKDNTRCDRCGEVGGHEVLWLGMVETAQILDSYMKRSPDA